MRRVIGTAATCALLVGCGKPAMPAQASADGATATAPVASVAAPASVKAPPPSPAKPTSDPIKVGPTLPMLAYSYQYVLQVPAARVNTLMRRHEQACEAAGPSVCQVVGASTDAEGRGEVAAMLKLRADPAWLRRFRDGLEADAAGAGGRVRSSGASTEDLSRQIVDTEAAVRAKTTLRDRLLQLLATHPGKLDDLIQLEEQVATTQGEIDATQSELAAMRTRVVTSALTLTYEAAGQAATDRAWRPLGEAGRAFIGNGVMVLAALIQLVSILWPVALIAALAAAGWRAWRARRGPTPTSARPHTPPTPEP